ncbi:MAG: hypothetical protein WBB76_07995 [Gaiellaceae bacterium]
MSLQAQWLGAVAAAVEAVEAAARAKAMRVEEASGRRKQLASERAWIDTFPWATVDRARTGTVVILDRRRAPASQAIKDAA